MKLKKILLLASIGVATFYTTNLYAKDTSVNSVQQSTSEGSLKIKSLIISNLDSLFPFQTQITVGKIEKNANGAVVVSDILVMSGGKGKPNISINQIIFNGLDFSGDVDNDFTIDINGLSVTNLATAVASSNIVSASDVVDTKSLANNNGLYSIIMNNLGQSIYNFKLNYSHKNKTLELDLNSTYSKQKFLQEKVKLVEVNLSNTIVNEDFLADLKNVVTNSKLDHAEFDADFAEMMKQVTTQYLGKDYKKTPDFNIKGSLGKVKGQLNIVVNGKLGDSNYLDSSLIVNDIDLDDSLKDILENDASALKNAYIQSNNTDMKIDMDFKKSSFSKDGFMQKIFNFIGKDNVNLYLSSVYKLNGPNYDTNLEISSSGLASIKASSKGIIDGKLKVLPLTGMTTATDNKGLYDCKDQLCLKDLNVSFTNSGLLEKVARYTNNDSNTSPSQILGSYGALLQLFAVQQDNKFLQKALSSLAMFLQNPKNISVDLDAKKPMNQNTLLTMLMSDAENIQKHNPIQGGRVNLKANPDLKLLNNIQKLFKIDFDVNK